jgi:catechol 2,3-dioxygenase-like lactoylglutathione lyase family enzyme
MKIKLDSVYVDDQDKAMRFYTKVLGFEKGKEIPAGDFRWMTVVSPESPNGVELVLEATSYPVARAFREALFRAGIPHAAFEVDDVRAELRLTRLGVTFA